MSNKPVVYFNEVKGKVTDHVLSIELSRSNGLSETGELVGVLYTDMPTALHLQNLVQEAVDEYGKLYSSARWPTPEALREKLLKKHGDSHDK